MNSYTQTISAVWEEGHTHWHSRTVTGWQGCPWPLVSPPDPGRLDPGAQLASGAEGLESPGLSVWVGLWVCVLQTRRQPCSHCAVWTACPASHGRLWIHHLIRRQGLPSAHGTASSHICCRGQLTWGPLRGTSPSPGAWSRHCLPRTRPPALSQHRPGLDIPHGVKKCQPQCQGTRGTPFSHFRGSWSQ